MSSQLTPIDYCVIETLSTVRVSSGAQLRKLYWPNSDTGRRLARHHLAKLTKLRLIARLDRRIGGVRAGSDGFTYTLDVGGHRLASTGNEKTRPRRPTTPGDRYLDHALAITERYVDLHDLEAAHTFEIIGFEAEPDSWRRYLGAHGRAVTVKPDAFTILANNEWEHRWFLEIDRGTEHRPTILRKANDYVTYWHTGTEQQDADVFPKVLWIAPDTTRTAQLTDWLAGLDPSAWQLFQVCTDAGFTRAITTSFASEASS
jgi:hypothetical protein